MQVRFIELHLCVDRHGNPLSGYILQEADSGQLEWLSDREFAPFDGLLDVTRWLSGVLRPPTPSARG